MSSALISKSKTSKFSRTRAGLVLLGMAEIPRCMICRMRIWAFGYIFQGNVLSHKIGYLRGCLVVLLGQLQHQPIAQTVGLALLVHTPHLRTAGRAECAVGGEANAQLLAQRHQLVLGVQNVQLDLEKCLPSLLALIYVVVLKMLK